MNWASIKSALNSTLGTSSFLSLDKMIENAKTYLGNKIDTNQTNIMNGIEGISVSTTGVGKVLEKRTIPVESGSKKEGLIISKFVAPVPGMYKVKIEYTCGYFGAGYINICHNRTKKYAYITELTDITSAGNGYKYNPTYEYLDGMNFYRGCSVGELFYYTSKKKELLMEVVANDLNRATVSSPNPYVFSFEGYIYCQSGEPVALSLYSTSSNGMGNLGITSITSTITYGNS